MNKPALNLAADVTAAPARNHAPRSIELTQNTGTLDANTDAAWRLAKSLPLNADETARVAAAEMQTRVWCNPHLVVEAQDRFLEAYGVRRGDDLRGEVGL